ncbi:hypothetical protein QO002_002152 [Pararhizobium capsulatum DSM 1112]|uniref:Uncharacterized protein n=1 Tax=Pararhizobium capsulatum DSM 1112 TaxID=1121113 RepID=A0ABU0BP43_9HYPH|nr:hypothetical protein [Pararhizobium capsulatum]MDQ0320014.1 hypothetical protein [Pararhizobium capsulatum DSM 1112]
MPVWLATKCGKVIKSAWIDGKGLPGRWAGLATKELPIAWQPYVVPAHPSATVQPMGIKTFDHDFMAACDGEGSV